MRNHIEGKLAEAQGRLDQLLERESQLPVARFDRRHNGLLEWRRRLRRTQRLIQLLEDCTSADEPAIDNLFGSIEDNMTRKKQKLSEEMDEAKVLLLEQQTIEWPEAAVGIRTFTLQISGGAQQKGPGQLEAKAGGRD